jgi:hypothetical protein
MGYGLPIGSSEVGGAENSDTEVRELIAVTAGNRAGWACTGNSPRKSNNTEDSRDFNIVLVEGEGKNITLLRLKCLKNYADVP